MVSKNYTQLFKTHLVSFETHVLSFGTHFLSFETHMLSLERYILSFEHKTCVTGVDKVQVNLSSQEVYTKAQFTAIIWLVLACLARFICLCAIPWIWRL